MTHILIAECNVSGRNPEQKPGELDYVALLGVQTHIPPIMYPSPTGDDNPYLDLINVSYAQAPCHHPVGV